MASDRFILQYPHFLKIQDPFTLAGAPLLFLYIRTLIKGHAGLSKKDLLHFIPFGLCLVFLLPFYFQSAGAKLLSVGSHFDYWKRWSEIRSVTLILQFITYLSLIAWMFIAYTRNLKREPAAAQRSVLFQIRFMLMTLTAVWVLGSFKFALTTIYPAYNTETVDLIIPASISLFVYAMGYLGLRRPEVLTGPDAASSRRYQTSSLTVERAVTYRQRLLDLMNTEKPYLDSDLTLQKLAKAVSISHHHLSASRKPHVHEPQKNRTRRAFRDFGSVQARG